MPEAGPSSPPLAAEPDPTGFRQARQRGTAVGAWLASLIAGTVFAISGGSLLRRLPLLALATCAGGLAGRVVAEALDESTARLAAGEGVRAPAASERVGADLADALADALALANVAVDEQEASS